ncbi:MAG TPA: FtsH protease activity modulator HflK [Devosia sp.]|jgi:membrane protease subunit HflK|uniref:FtsH protease activity modulator HflK n=1 Tax=Devosia sp. TaxID=1871048 RepID=UPI002DDCF47A|nr:FtsH protease activity modulator HflK [Devosia sp.]HEV2515019.1 FtsH protease activity modulator HflK [Devosia sp.]
MPWDNNTGGGGRNSNNGGPWGQAPGGGGSGGGGGGGRRGGGTPNLEEILSRGRDRFQGGIPGGRWTIIGVVLALGAFWVANSVFTVQEQEWAVKLRFGQPLETVPAGLHFALWPIETVERAPRTENRTEIGSVGSSRTQSDEGLMLSGDQNIVDVKFSVLWSVTDPVAYLFNVRDPDDMVRSIGESAMREIVGRRPAQDVFRDDRAGIQNDVRDIVQSIIQSYGMGVTVSQIAIEQAAPPTEVADAFNEVQRAEQDEDRFQEEARQYANTLLGDARGQAAQVREDAAAYKNRVVQEAEGEAARFLSIYAEYAKAPEVTRKRLFLETMEQVLGGSEKVLVDQSASGSGVVPYLPLPEIRPNSTLNSTPVPADATPR